MLVSMGHKHDVAQDTPVFCIVRGENSIADNINIISDRCNHSLYCYVFHFYTRDHTVFEIIIVVCNRITSEDGGCYIATDKFYTTLDNVYMFSIK